ncbi:MAG: acetyl-CoA carboxylase biotin carboxylase subunit [Acidobacteriota bacterium]
MRKIRAIEKVLIANRGEIAVRIIRTLREMGIISVAIYSDADRTALHVRMADEAYYVGPSPSSESYLNMGKIIQIAKDSGCQAIHPGYGFLAENSEFGRLVEKESLIFIGSHPESISLMGSKTEARKTMKDLGVPVVPGTLYPAKDIKELIKEAEKLGYPVLLKADLGGGGKGMRFARNIDELKSFYELSRSEALSSFGDPSIYIEKYINEPHHIEIQILGDNYGNVIYLGERECSIQRRYQKVVEETPSPFLDSESRKIMGEIAAEAARKLGYRSAGTMEFIVDKDKNFYFLEMNTRLQVEHPITEMVTGIDLVKCQVEIASGKTLQYTQESINPKGCSIESRIYAEDPDNDFAPSPGKILAIQNPSGFGIRDDCGVYEGYEIPIFYDPLISKLISWGNDRREAINRMLRALSEYYIIGVKTTIPFFEKILKHPEFMSGSYNTHFIDKLEKKKEEFEETRKIAVIAVGLREIMDKSESIRQDDRKISSPWKTIGRWLYLQSRL